MANTVASEINRIITDRNTIRSKFVSLGIANSIDTLDDLATAAEGIENRGAVQAELKEGETYNIPKGYHNGSGTVLGVAGGGNYSLQSKEITPTKSQQNVVSDDGYYGLSSVTVNAIPDNYQDVSATTATAGDVLVNKIFTAANGESTTGTMANNGAISGSIDGLTSTSFTVAAGYTSGGTVTLTDDILNALIAI